MNIYRNGYHVDEVAQITAPSTPERETAHWESQLESSRFFHPVLMQEEGMITRILYADPADQNKVREFFCVRNTNQERDLPAGQLRYYRFRVGDFSIPETLRLQPPSAKLFRHLPFIGAGSGIGAPGRRMASDKATDFGSLLPVHRSLRRDAQRRIYSVPTPPPLQTQLFQPQTPDRWRTLSDALLEVGQRQPALLMIRVQGIRLPPLYKRYLENSALLIGETPGFNPNASPSSYEVLRTLATGPFAFKTEIMASDSRLIAAFQADTDARALVPSLPRIPTLRQDDETKEYLHMLAGIASLYTLEEAATLLTPRISFHHALPGANHFFPHHLTLVTAHPVSQRTAHSDPQGDFPLGKTDSGRVKTMNVESLRTGCVLAGPPGTGKTTGAMNIVRHTHRLYGEQLKLNIIDPVGYEWKQLAEELKIRVISFEPGSPPPLCFNPFFAPEAVTLADHAASLSQLMTAVFPGNRTCQAYLTSMILATYSEKWKAMRGDGMEMYRVSGAMQRQYPETCPTFAEFLYFGPRWLEMQAGASKDHTENVEYFKLRGKLLQGSLVAATLSGTQPLSEQLTGSFVLCLQSIVTKEIKHALLALFLGLSLGEIYGGGQDAKTGRMERLLVLEEAHEILGTENRRQNDENLVEGASELIAQMMVDILRTSRKYGVGTLILDQSLSSLDANVLKCCSNLLALRTPYPQDQETLAKLMGLSSLEARDLISLETGECIARIEGNRMPFRIRLDAGMNTTTGHGNVA